MLPSLRGSGGRGSNGDVRRGDDRFSVGRGRVPPDRVGLAAPVSPGPPVRLLVGLWIAAGLAAGASALVLALSDAAPTAAVILLAGSVGVLVLLPLLVLRSLRSGHLSARHDGARLRGLFQAALDVNRSMGMDETRAAVLASAGTLLRAPDVTVTEERPARPALAEPMQVADRTLWLGVAGRSPTEPFDDADRALLQALASVGAVALANAELYAEVRQQREKLSIITGSLGEGVCAVSEDGRITFMNPAGAGMLGWYGLETDDEGPVVPATEAPDFLREPALRAMALGRNVTSDDTLFQRLDGSHFPVTMTASPVLGRFRLVGGRHRVPRHLRTQGLRGAVGPPCLPGRLDRLGQPPPPPRPPRPRAVAGEPDRAARWRCSSATSTASRW